MISCCNVRPSPVSFGAPARWPHELEKPNPDLGRGGRAQARISAAERKRRTRRLILLGSYLEHVTGDDPGKRDSLMKGLDVFLERDRDRELFDLLHKENPNGKPS